MRIILFVIIVMSSVMACAQGFNERIDAFGDGEDQWGVTIEEVAGGYVIISNYDDDFPLLTRIDEQGEVLWEKLARRAQGFHVHGTRNCSDSIPGGGFVLTGTIYSNIGNSSYRIGSMRLDAQGDTLWTRAYNSNPSDVAIGRSCVRLPDGGFIIVGTISTILADRGIVIRTDANGNEIWRRNYQANDGDNMSFYSVSEAADGGLYLNGSESFSSNPTSHYTVQLRTDSLAFATWSTPLGIYDRSVSFAAGLSDGNLVTFGIAAPNTYSYPHIAKFDSTNGSVIWEREYGAPEGAFYAGAECPNGDLIAAGYARTTSNWTSGTLLRTTSTGDSLWMYNYTSQNSLVGHGEGMFLDVIPKSDSGFIAVGRTQHPIDGPPYPPGNSNDTWVVKVDGNGCILPGCVDVGITEQVTDLLDACTIEPNPASQRTSVRLSLPAALAERQLDVSIVSMDGRMVQRERIFGNGAHALALTGLAPGLYHVHVATSGTWLTGAKLVVE